METNPLSVLHQAMLGVTLDIAVKERRMGGSTHQVPIEIGSTQGKALVICWLLWASQKIRAFKLSFELVDVPKGIGNVIHKKEAQKEETHRIAEANKAFAHFR